MLYLAVWGLLILGLIKAVVEGLTEREGGLIFTTHVNNFSLMFNII